MNKNKVQQLSFVIAAIALLVIGLGVFYFFSASKTCRPPYQGDPLYGQYFQKVVSPNRKYVAITARAGSHGCTFFKIHACDDSIEPYLVEDCHLSIFPAESPHNTYPAEWQSDTLLLVEHHNEQTSVSSYTLFDVEKRETVRKIAAGSLPAPTEMLTPPPSNPTIWHVDNISIPVDPPSDLSCPIDAYRPDYWVWSSDGFQLAITTHSENPVCGEPVFVADIDQSEKRGTAWLLKNQYGVASLSWSPDDTRLAIYATPLGPSTKNTSAVSVVSTGDPFNSIELPLKDSPTCFDHTYHSIDPVWSPDGSRIAFVSRDETCKRRLYVIRADGSEQILAGDGFVYIRHPKWSPDGTEIAIKTASNLDGRDPIIYVVKADGSAQSRNAPEWLPQTWKKTTQ